MRRVRFVDIASFTQDWSDLGYGDEHLQRLESEIQRDPTRPPVVPGGGGVRKIRFAPSGSGRGKSGGSRVLYALMADHGIVLLVAAWSKTDQEDLSKGDYRAIEQLIAQIRQQLMRGIIQ